MFSVIQYKIRHITYIIQVIRFINICMIQHHGSPRPPNIHGIQHHGSLRPLDPIPWIFTQRPLSGRLSRRTRLPAHSADIQILAGSPVSTGALQAYTCTQRTQWTHTPFVVLNPIWWGSSFKHCTSLLGVTNSSIGQACLSPPYA